MKADNFFLMIFSIVLISEGLLFFLSVYKTSKFIGLILISLGFFIFRNGFNSRDSNNTSLNTLFRYGKLNSNIISMVLIISVLLYEYFLSANSFGNYSLLLLILGIYILVFDRINYRYNYEKFFVLNFITIYLLLLLLPLLFFGVSNSFNSSGANFVFVKYFLASPLSFFLNLSGIEAVALDQILSYRDVNGELTKIHIARECTGIDSVIIFLSAYIAYLINELSLKNSLFFKFLLLGVLISYIANLLRMYLIIIVGYYYGAASLYWAHTNLGWIIFIFWMWIFWTFLPTPTTTK